MIQKIYSELTNDEQSDMVMEFQEKYYCDYCIEDIDNAFMFIDPWIDINSNGEYNVWEAYKNGFEKKLEELKQKNTRI